MTTESGHQQREIHNVQRPLKTDMPEVGDSDPQPGEGTVDRNRPRNERNDGISKDTQRASITIFQNLNKAISPDTWPQTCRWIRHEWVKLETAREGWGWGWAVSFAAERHVWHGAYAQAVAVNPLKFSGPQFTHL